MKLLSICIPTYNRAPELAELCRSFLTPMLDRFETECDVHVLDNSDPDIAALNKANLDPRVIYRKNPENVGFAGNVRNCVEAAQSEYMWLLPDNDAILMDGFEQMLDRLRPRDLDCLLVPFSAENVFGQTNVVGYARHDFSLPAIACLKKAGSLPFVLLSGAVIRRTSQPDLSDIFANYSDCAFIQMPLFLAHLDPDSPAGTVTLPVIDYKVEYDSRFSPYGTYLDIVRVADYLEQSYGFALADVVDREYRSCLWSIIADATYIYRVHRYEWARANVARHARDHLSARTLVVLAVLYLPRRGQALVWLIRSAYAYARTTKNAPGGMAQRFAYMFRRLRGKMRDRRAALAPV